MSAVLYGNLSAEIVGDVGVRVQRLIIRQNVSDMLHPVAPGVPRKTLMLGREQEAADGLAAIQEGRPLEFHAACGYGKTTLLQNLAAVASERGLADACIYVRADRDRVDDLLQQMVARLYVAERPVKLTANQCALLLSQVTAVVAVDDIDARPDQVGYLLDVLSGCSLVIGSARPVLGGRGISHDLDGLPEQSALALIAGELGRPLTAEELPAVKQLRTSVNSQPLHLRQCAALAREGRHSFRSLARQASHDPGALDRLSINALAQDERRALAVLALAAGVLLPAGVVEIIGQVALVGEWLESLRRRGLAEQRNDRFGLPACKTENYRQLLFQDLHLAASARELSTWLTASDPLDAGSQSAAEAAMAIMEFAAERRDWPTVVRLARAAERALFIAGRWEAWQHTLSHGLEAARASADKAAVAFFSHQQGTLAFCQDQLSEAHRLLEQALSLRKQIGDEAGVELTRHNMRLLEPPDLPPLRRLRVARRVLPIAGSVLTTLALAAGTVAIAGGLRSRQPVGQPTGPAATSGTITPGSSPAGGTNSGSAPASTTSSGSLDGQSNSGAALIPQAISFTSSPPPAPAAGEIYAVHALGGASGQPVTFTIDASSRSVCTISGSIVTFDNPGSCIIDANQAGNAEYQRAPQAEQNATVSASLIPQAISFTSSPPYPPLQGNTYVVTASGGGSGQPVTFSIDASSSSVCTISGSTVTYDNLGNCVIDANQGGNTQYQAAPQAQQTVTVINPMQ